MDNPNNGNSTPETITQALYDAIERNYLPPIYSERLNFELAEISKQGSWSYWLRLVDEGKVFDSNPNHLLIPWLLDMIVIRTADGSWRRSTYEEWLELDPLATRDVTKVGPLLTTCHYQAVGAVIAGRGTPPDEIVRDKDTPDIDLDCLPEARDVIKAYATAKYGSSSCNGDTIGSVYGNVCAVGTWQTYKLSQALIDVFKALGSGDKNIAIGLSTQLPQEADDIKDGGVSACKGRVQNSKGEMVECKHVHALARCPKCGSDATDSLTIGKLLEENAAFREFNEKYPMVVDYATRLIGKIKTSGQHAGAIIISDQPLYGNIPLSIRKNVKTDELQWLSTWTEGRSTQLSKLGYIKWDILGLLNHKFITECCNLLRNRNIRFGAKLEGWDDVDPTVNRAGWYEQLDEATGVWVRHVIPLNDPDALRLANESKTDAVFQFDTALAKRILSNGVSSFNDLMLFNAMGHPGPMDSIPEAVANRDGANPNWRAELAAVHPELLEILEPTYGVIVFQEQLASIWQRLGGFTAPEAQDARKAVAKKWRHLLEPIEKKWLDGASKTIGVEAAKLWWTKMVTFGRYAFNLSHAVSYCLVAYRCLFLKAHFPAEWIAAVMSYCHHEKLIRYRLASISEGVKFGTYNPDNLTIQFTVSGDVVNPGLIGLKGVGIKAANAFVGVGHYTDIDEFVRVKPKSKTVLERLIKLGAFTHIHSNRLATWKWYLYRYGSGPDAAAVRKAVTASLLVADGWTPAAIEAERARQLEVYRRRYPNRKTVPVSITKYYPKPEVTRERVMALYQSDYTIAEVLDFELAFLGYNITNALLRYKYNSALTITNVQAIGGGWIHAVVKVIEYGQTKAEDPMCRMTVSDGVKTLTVLLWSDDIEEYKGLLDKLSKLIASKVEPGVAVKVQLSSLYASATLWRQANRHGGWTRSPSPTIIRLEMADAT